MPRVQEEAVRSPPGGPRLHRRGEGSPGTFRRLSSRFRVLAVLFNGSWSRGSLRADFDFADEVKGRLERSRLRLCWYQGFELSGLTKPVASVMLEGAESGSPGNPSLAVFGFFLLGALISVTAFEVPPLKRADAVSAGRAQGSKRSALVTVPYPQLRVWTRMLKCMLKCSGWRPKKQKTILQAL